MTTALLKGEKMFYTWLKIRWPYLVSVTFAVGIVLYFVGMPYSIFVGLSRILLALSFITTLWAYVLYQRLQFLQASAKKHPQDTSLGWSRHWWLVGTMTMVISYLPHGLEGTFFYWMKFIFGGMIISDLFLYRLVPQLFMWWRSLRQPFDGDPKTRLPRKRD